MYNRSKLDFSKASFKTFENPEGMNIFQKAAYFYDYTLDMEEMGHWNFGYEGLIGNKAEVMLQLPGQGVRKFISMVSNGYLGHAEHPEVIAAAIAGIRDYGTGTGASPAIGGRMSFHREIEEKIARFFKREAAMVYTTGYTANSATMQALLKKQDLAIVDADIHSSMNEGIEYTTNVKRFPHNNMEYLERLLQNHTGKYRSTMVIVDGVYSQAADLAPLNRIVELCKHYNAFLAMDDAHGVGVIGETGRGVIELYQAYHDVDVITGTFSKALGHLGGYVVGSKELIHYLKYQARQYIFSVAPTPASACLLKSIDLIDEEPWRRNKLWENINYLKKGLKELGFDTGNSASAIVPVMTGGAQQNAEICKWLMEAGIYANQIAYPAVAQKRARIRMSVMTTHSLADMDDVLNAWEWVKTKLNIKNFE